MNICILCDKSVKKVMVNKLNSKEILVLGVYSKLCESTLLKIAEINPHRVVVNADNLSVGDDYKDKNMLDFFSDLLEHVENTPIIYITGTSSGTESLDISEFIKHGIYNVLDGTFAQNVSAVKELIVNPKSKKDAVAQLNLMCQSSTEKE